MSRSGGRAARDFLAFAADVPLHEGVSLYEAISSHVAYAKVGLSLYVEHGPVAVERFLKAGAHVFLDLKLHDIPNTVELAARHAGALGIALLTVHASGGEAMLKAAVRGAREGALKSGHPAPRVLAVTVLTSLTEEDLRDVGVPDLPLAQVERLSALAARSGVDGLVCSPREVARVRRLHPSLFLCTPGIRARESETGDQARTSAPEEALQGGSDLLVVGRPIYSASSPVSVARALEAQVTAQVAALR